MMRLHSKTETRAASKASNADLVKPVQKTVDRPGRNPIATEAPTFYQEFLDQLPLGAYRTTPDGRFDYANAALAELLGYPSVEKLKQANARHLYVDLEDRRRWQQQIQAAVNDELVCFKTQMRRL